ncbi:MAG: class I SAM-dependent methyltransferase [Myxococcota bacterium]|jgi:SAM-dependent methyltransferase|nr:class I SAM-dependent methyltransferase [Myxococcota bacterium]
MSTFSDARYLEAKKTVDDRALNQRVLASLRNELAARSESATTVLEVGAGIGTMATRLIDWQVLSRAEYTLLDVELELLAEARRRFVSWGNERGLVVDEPGDSLRLHGANVDVTVRFVAAELSAFLESSAGPHDVDLLVANAFLDIVDVPSTLPRLFARGARGGLFWFCINFDGETMFLPEHADDRALLDVYHRSMDERVRHGRPAGDSKTGRHLLVELPRAGASLVAAGASDWVVFPSELGYPADEAYFLRHIVNTIRSELERHAEVPRSALTAWCDERNAQIERNELCYIAHQLDFTGRLPR